MNVPWKFYPWEQLFRPCLFVYILNNIFLKVSFKLIVYKKLHSFSLRKKMFFNFCTYHKELFPFAYFRWFFENISTQSLWNLPDVNGVILEVSAQTEQFVLEIERDSVELAWPARKLIKIMGLKNNVCNLLTCAWSCKFSICDASFKPLASERNSTIAFKQANSAGSTRIDLNRQNTSCNVRISWEIWEKSRLINCSYYRHYRFHSMFFTLSCLFSGEPLLLLKQCSETEKSEHIEDSSGKHHCIAFSRKRADQDSSNRITWSRKARLAKLGKFFAHFTAMKRSRALVS